MEELLMKQLFTLLILIAIVSMTGNVFAQEKRFELFAGYSPLRNFSGADGGVEHPDTLRGWNASLTTYIKPWIGITADFSGHYDGRYFRIGFLNDSIVIRGNEFMSHRGMVGPQVKLRHGRWEPFSHAMFGVGRISTEALPPSTGGGHSTHFAYALGGGLDLSVSERVKIRLIQADYMRLKTDGVAREGLRTSFGLVFSF
jgi:opacity protein-like surface antigen